MDVLKPAATQRLLCLLAAAFASHGSASGTGGTLEYEVKAAMLYNFTRFIEWPAGAWKDARSPLAMCVLGADPFGQSLDEALHGKTYAGRPIRVRRVQAVSEAEGCHVVFVSRSERKKAAALVHALQAMSAVTVSDIEDFSRAGGTIGFVTVDNKIRFEINAGPAGKAGIAISSKLLRLAVSSERPKGDVRE